MDKSQECRRNSDWNKWHSQILNIDNQFQISHDIIKEDARGMTKMQLRIYTEKWIKNLMENLEQQNINNLFNDNLKFHDKEETPDIIEEAKTDEVTLHEDLMLLKHFPHKKRNKYSFNQVLELGVLIRKYPNNLSTIRKNLKIPLTSFKRLVKEWQAHGHNTINNRRKSSQHSNLNEVEKIYISNLIKPPTYPTSVPQI